MRRLESQLKIAGIFLAGLILATTPFLVAYGRGSIASSDLESILVSVLATYATPLAVILAGVFGGEPKKAQRSQTPGLGKRLKFAVALAVLWNCMILWRTSLFFVRVTDDLFDDPHEISTVLQYIDLLSKSSSFLVAGALAWLFGKSAD